MGFHYNMKYGYCYRYIVDWYSNRTAKRSGVPLINHIDEGLNILVNLGASTNAKGAWCIHPLVQDDDAMVHFFVNLDRYPVSSEVLLLAMEYRNVANRYLCKPETDHYTVKDLPEILLGDVKNMLIADKLQNYKDFMKYHYGKHERSDQLYKYFNLWLDHLGVDHGIRQEYATPQDTETDDE